VIVWLGAEAHSARVIELMQTPRGGVLAARRDPALATEGKTDRVRVEHVVWHQQTITQIPDASLLRAGDLPRPGTQASAELVRPLIRRFEDDATPLTAHQYLALSVNRHSFGSRPPDCRHLEEFQCEPFFMSTV